MINIVLKTDNAVGSIVEANRGATFRKSSQQNLIVNDQTVIVVANNLRIFAYDTTIPNIIVALVGTGIDAILVCSVYLNPADLRNEMTRFLSYIKKYLNHPIIIAGDFNCQHVAWSSKSQFGNGEADNTAKLLNDFIWEHSLLIYNSPPNLSNYTFMKNGNDPQSVSWIDLLIGNVEGKDFELTEELVTDHRMLRLKFYLSVRFHDKLRFQQYRTYFTPLKNKELNMKIDMSNSYEMDQTFRRIIHSNFDNEKKCLIKYRKHNLKILKMRKRIKLLKRNNKYNFSEEINEMVRDLRQQELIEREKTKRNTLLYLMKNLKNNEIVWPIINKIIKPKDSLSAVLSDDDCRQRELWGFIYKYPHFTHTSGTVPNYLTEAEESMIRRMTFRKQSGYADNFTIKTWETFWSKNKDELIKLIKITFEKGYIPQTIKIFGAHFIPKPDGTFRVIRISNFLLKIYDKILSLRIQKILSLVLIKRTQFAYQKDQNILDLQVILSEKWSESKILICADVSKAFDMVKIDYALEELSKVMLNSDVELIKHFVHGRWLRTKVDKTFKYKPDPFGVPQGSSVGPLLFIVALNKVIRMLKMKNVDIMAFADDLFVITKLTDSEKVLEIVSTELQKANLTLNRGKTKILSGSSKETVKIVGMNFNLKPTIVNIDRQIELCGRTLIRNQQTLYTLPHVLKKYIINAFTLSLLSSTSPQILFGNNDYLDLFSKIIHRINTFIKKQMRLPINISAWTPIAILGIVNPLHYWIKNVLIAVLRSSMDHKRWPFVSYFQPLPFFIKTPNMEAFYRKKTLVPHPRFPLAGYKIKGELIQVTTQHGTQFFKIEETHGIRENHYIAIFIMVKLTQNDECTYIIPKLLTQYQNSYSAKFVVNLCNMNPNKFMWMCCEKFNNVDRPKGIITTIKNKIVSWNHFLREVDKKLNKFFEDNFEKDDGSVCNFFTFKLNVINFGRIGDMYAEQVLRLISNINLKIRFLNFYKEKDHTIHHYLNDCKTTEAIRDGLNGWKFTGTRTDILITSRLKSIDNLIDKKLMKCEANIDPRIARCIITRKQRRIAL